tara:strand:+ start:74199 stop:74618 length:420 start_codon:yes stop_codon:yes gene_type:complete
MKIFHLFLVLILASTISCKEKKPVIKPQEKKVASKEIHFICVNKCEGSGSDVAGNCPTCNTPYTHNQAFHNNEFLKNGPLKVPKIDLNSNPKTNASKSPAQNAFGVYHYICTNGCYGGAGSASKCTTCGLDLVHNQAYH